MSTLFGTAQYIVSNFTLCVEGNLKSSMHESNQQLLTVSLCLVGWNFILFTRSFYFMPCLTIEKNGIKFAHVRGVIMSESCNIIHYLLDA